MQEWLRDKLDQLTKEFLSGEGPDVVFEAQYLVYLECLVAATKGTKSAHKVWVDWHSLCVQKTPEGEQPSSLSYRIGTREELVLALQLLKSQFEGPTRRVFRAPKATPKAEPDLFDLLSEEDR